ELLTNILDPNVNVAAGYEEYMIRTADGQLITGVMANQSATAVTLRRRKGEQDTVLRSNIAELRALTVSAMPDNLEESINLYQMSDLLEFLKSVETFKTGSADPTPHVNKEPHPRATLLPPGGDLWIVIVAAVDRLFQLVSSLLLQLSHSD